MSSGARRRLTYSLCLVAGPWSAPCYPGESEVPESEADSVSESPPGLEEQLEQLLVGITGDTARMLKQYLGPSHA